ncbi:MAG TPA: GNAT family protein [Alphaproteobacteria bacterium]|nr:GNAT family protein [Alphaproteobacteria bacterium]
MSAWLKSGVLAGRHVRMEPLEPRHVAPLAEIAIDPELTRWFVTPLADRAAFDRWVDAAFAEQADGRSVPYVTWHIAENRPVGSSRFMSIAEGDRRAEIGNTFVGRAWQRSAVNTEAKLLMLAHAFETAGAVRIEFRTDARNERSQAALAGIGATREGVFRRHMLRFDGTWRDSVYFSVLDGEWPRVRALLEARLERA